MLRYLKFKLKLMLKMLVLIVSILFLVIANAGENPILPNAQAEILPRAADNSISNPVLIFISFSMPLGSLQQWASQAQKIHAPLIIRGLVHDSFMETQKAVKQLSVNGTIAGVVVDPRLFTEYHITQVPTVVVRKISNTACLQNQSCWHPENFDVISGDVGLESALQMISERGDSAALIAQQQLKQWRAS